VLGLGKRNKLMVGLDVGRDSARIASLYAAGNEQYLLRGASVAQLSDGVRVEEVVKGLRRKVVRRSQGIHCNLGPINVIVHEALFPDMPAEDLRSAARLEVGQLIVDLHGMAVDFQVTGRRSSDEGEQVRVLIVAVPMEAVSARANLLERAGVRALSVVPDGIALANAVATLHPPDEGAGIILDIGRDFTVLVTIMPGNEIVAPVVRHMPGGLDLISTDEQGALDLGGEAERDQWLQEVERSLQFVAAKLGAPAERLLVVGSGAGSRELLEWMELNLAISVHPWNPLIYLGRDGKALSDEFVRDHGPSLAVAVGLALMEES
jgi:Tfp pilus assembly PilM family ATPase